MTDYETAKAIADLLPTEYKKAVVNSLIKLSRENDEWAFKRFMIMLYLVLYPRKNEFWAMHEHSCEEWRNRAKALLLKLRNRSEKK